MRGQCTSTYWFYLQYCVYALQLLFLQYCVYALHLFLEVLSCRKRKFPLSACRQSEELVSVYFTHTATLDREQLLLETIQKRNLSTLAFVVEMWILVDNCHPFMIWYRNIMLPVAMVFSKSISTGNNEFEGTELSVSVCSLFQVNSMEILSLIR